MCERQVYLKLFVVLWILVMTILVFGDSHTATMSQSMVIPAVQATRKNNMSSKLLDFYLSQQNLSSRSSHHYFNVIQNVWDTFLNKSEKRTFSSDQYPETEPSGVDNLFDYMEQSFGNKDSLVLSIENVRKKNESIVEYYLRQQNESLHKEKTLNQCMRTASYHNFHDSFTLAYGLAPQANFENLLHKNKDFSPTSVHIPTTTASKVFDLEEFEREGNVELDKMMSDFNKSHRGNLEQMEKLIDIMHNLSDWFPSITKTPPFVEVETFLKNLNPFKVFMKKTEKVRTYFKKPKRSIFKRYLYRFLNSMRQIIYFDVLNFQSKSNQESGFFSRKFLNLIFGNQKNKVIDWFRRKFQKNSTEKVLQSQGILRRKRRQVREYSSSLDNETKVMKSGSKGFLSKVMNFFIRTKSDRNTMSTQNWRISEQTGGCELQDINNELGYDNLKSKTSNSSEIYKTANITREVKEEGEKRDRHHFVTKNSDEDFGKRFIQNICNITGEIPLVKAKDYAANLSTRLGQDWFEALDEHMNDKSRDFVFDSSASNSEETTAHKNQKGLWKYFQKSLIDRTKSLNNVITTSNCFPSGKSCMNSSRSRITEINSIWMQTSVSPCVRNVFSKSAHSSEPTRFRFTTKTTMKDKSSISVGKFGALWKYFRESVLRATTVSHTTTVTLKSCTCYPTRRGVFTYRKKAPTTSTTCEYNKKDSEDTFLFTDDVNHYFNGTIHYDDFNAYMRASAPPELGAFFTDSFTSSTPRVTIRRSLLDMIKKIFRGGRDVKEKTGQKTSLEENFEHYKHLCETYKAKGNISQKEFEKKNLGKIKLKYSYECLNE